jgi:flagellar motility protein MotE (MotC chaperone)
MSDDELIEIGETAVSVLGDGAAEKLSDIEDLLDDYSIPEIRKRLQRLEQLEERMADLEESVDFNQLRDIVKRAKSAAAAAEKLESALSDLAGELVEWMTDLHARLR